MNSDFIRTEFLQRVPRQVQVVEVGPRDGLQNEAVLLSTADKARFVELLAEAGFSAIEVSSFVNPKRVPQLADASEVFALLALRPEIRYSALVPNAKGLERAVAAGVTSIALFTAASETFTKQNIGMTIAESLDGFRAMMDTTHAYGLWVRAYVSTAFVCPYEGLITPAQVAAVVQELLALGVDEISIGDTIGHATPDSVARLTEALLPILPLPQMAYHFHDTRGTALANVLMALQYGVAIFDSAAGGVGGCPFAPGAAGNLASEDLLTMLQGMGIDTGIDLEKVILASRFLASKLDHPLFSRRQ